MNTQSLPIRSKVRRAAPAIVLVSVLAAGGAWRAMAAGQATPAQPAAQAVSAPSAARAQGVGRRESYADVVQAVAPSVVTIRVESKQAAPTGGGPDEFFQQFFGPQGRQPQRQPRAQRRQGLGSGVIVAADGYILTNHHVVDDATDIRVDFTDGRSLPATLVGSDAPSDLALVKVAATGLPAVTFGDSDAVRVGDLALALGNPLGVGQTVTMGIISAKGRSTGVGDGSYEDFLQTDAPINHGNSGGALVDVNGALIGINAQIVSNSDGNIGIGLAIPSKMAQHVMAALRRDGRVRRGQLGVTAQPVTTDMAASLGLARAEGVIVAEVAPDSAAERAGLKQGDVITSFNGQTIADGNTLRNRVADTAPGSKVTVQLTRDGGSREVTVTLGEVPSTDAVDSENGAADHQAALGVAVTPLTPALATEQGLAPHVRGVVVQSVREDSRAERAGLRPGDVIESVNRQPVHDAESLRQAVGKTAGRPMLLLVNRGGREAYVTASAT